MACFSRLPRTPSVTIRNHHVNCLDSRGPSRQNDGLQGPSYPLWEPQSWPFIFRIRNHPRLTIQRGQLHKCHTQLDYTKYPYIQQLHINIIQDSILVSDRSKHHSDYNVSKYNISNLSSGWFGHLDTIWSRNILHWDWVYSEAKRVDI